MFFSPEIEYSKLLASEEWRLSSVNETYEICSSYSSKLVVPKQITDDQLIQSASFRELGRFPLLSYRHCENGAVLMKSSQPNMNNTKRCKADEAILNCLLNKSQRGYIIDTIGKSKWNAENEQHYHLWKKFIRPIGSFSSSSGCLDCFSKLIEACSDTSISPSTWLQRLETSGWLTLIHNSLNTACIVAQCMAQEGAPVIVRIKNQM